MDAIEILIFLAMLALIGYAVYHKAKRNEQDFNHLYQPADDTSLTSSDAFEGVLTFTGNSHFETQRFQLERGAYRLYYQFPEGSFVHVELFSASGDDSAVLALKKGEGTEQFTIGNDGHYFCVIEPQVEGEGWLIEISRLGLPSQRNGQSANGTEHP